MRYLKEYNSVVWDSKNQKYKEINSEEFEKDVKDCFIEFEDDGWYWKSYSDNSISLYHYPHYNFKMSNDLDSSIVDVDFTGKISKDGEIEWENKEIKFKNHSNYFKKEIERCKEESENFLIAIKRFNEITSQGFSFSYNNKGGDLKIGISGRL